MTWRREKRKTKNMNGSSEGKGEGKKMRKSIMWRSISLNTIVRRNRTRKAIQFAFPLGKQQFLLFLFGLQWKIPSNAT